MAVSKKFRWTNADGESVEVDIGAESENVTVEGIPLDEVLSNKADKQTEDGGFVGGDGATLNAYGPDGYGGAAIGKNAKSVEGGGAVGEGAIGDNGGGVGYNAQGLNGGGAVGYKASATYGGAVGSGAKTERGFAGGYEAQTVNGSNTAIDAIQLGTGTNSNERTLQVYDYQMMDENGNIPMERMKKANTYSSTPVQVGTWIDSTPVWRVAIPMTSVSEISLNTNNKSWSIRSDQILDRLSIINDTSNFIHIDSMIRFQNSNDYDPEAFATGWTEMFPGYFNGEAENVDYATHFYGWIEFALPASSVSAV